MPSFYTPISILVLAPGAFLVLAVLTALQNKFKAPSATNIPGDEIACGGHCAGCTGHACSANHLAIAEQKVKEALALQEKLKAEKAAKAAAKKAAEEQKGGEGK
jgi:electron transport complex protein RnfE